MQTCEARVAGIYQVTDATSMQVLIVFQWPKGKDVVTWFILVKMKE